MGLFSKIKNMFKGYSEDNDKKEKIERVEEKYAEEESSFEEVEEKINVEQEENEEIEDKDIDEEEYEEEQEEISTDQEEEDLNIEQEENEDNDLDKEEQEEEKEEISTDQEEEDLKIEQEENEDNDLDKKEYEEEQEEEQEEISTDQDEEDLNIEQEENEEEKIVKEEKKEKKKWFFGKEKKKKDKEEEIKKSVRIYEKGLTKSREGFVSKLANLTNKYYKITEEYFEELEEILIMADIGVSTVMDFMDRLRKRVRDENITDPSLLKEIIVDELFIIYVNDEVLSSRINYNENGPTVILFIGVNGVGKTTTIGKIANKLKDEGRKVLLVGADTFRAGAVDQLREWSEKVDVGFFGKENSDPASVVYDGIEKAKKEEFDVVLIDTAGRLQNKVNLMKELEKINKVIDSLVEGGASETLLVIDATTGQNGISQAKAFQEVTNITGIVLTKLDGTAKGGIVLAIKESVGIPVKYIGLGETKDDLQTFDIEKYIYGLFKDMM